MATSGSGTGGGGGADGKRAIPPEALERALQGEVVNATAARVEENLASLREDPRFKARVGE